MGLGPNITSTWIWDTPLKYVFRYMGYDKPGRITRSSGQPADFSLQKCLVRKWYSRPGPSGLGSAIILTLLYLSSALNRQVNETVSAVAGRVVVSPKDALLGGLFFSTGTPLPPADMAVVRKTYGVTDVCSRVVISLRR
jgi:hypothetical protein